MLCVDSPLFVKSWPWLACTIASFVGRCYGSLTYVTYGRANRNRPKISYLPGRSCAAQQAYAHVHTVLNADRFKSFDHMGLCHEPVLSASQRREDEFFIVQHPPDPCNACRSACRSSDTRICGSRPHLLRRCSMRQTWLAYSHKDVSIMASTVTIRRTGTRVR